MYNAVIFPADAEVNGQVRGEAPIVLEKCRKVLAGQAAGGIADEEVGSVGVAFKEIQQVAEAQRAFGVCGDVLVGDVVQPLGTEHESVLAVQNGIVIDELKNAVGTNLFRPARADAVVESGYGNPGEPEIERIGDARRNGVGGAVEIVGGRVLAAVVAGEELEVVSIAKAQLIDAAGIGSEGPVAGGGLGSGVLDGEPLLCDLRWWARRWSERRLG